MPPPPPPPPPHVRMVTEVLNCIQLPSECDDITNRTTIFGCAALCSDIHRADIKSIDNSFEVLPMAVRDENLLKLKGETEVLDEVPSELNKERLRKRRGNSQPESRIAKKRRRYKGGAINKDQTVVSISNNASQIPDEHEETENTRIQKIVQQKDPFLAVKSRPCPRLEPGDDTDDDIDVEEAAIEWDRCVSLQKKFGILKSHKSVTPLNAPHCAPHPGYVGDDLKTMLCKICQKRERKRSTVICDECQEAFHVACCVPRISRNYFKIEAEWFCSSCREKKKTMDLKLMERCSPLISRLSTVSHNASKARLGPAHQANVPLWSGNTGWNDARRSLVGHIGTEIPLTPEEKSGEKIFLLKEFKEKVEPWCSLPSETSPNGMQENWLQCNNVIVRAFTDSAGGEINQVVCGKWRRAPLNAQQSDAWECFCAMEWDPLHADCAVPQELPTEEILKRMQNKVPGEEQGPDVMESKEGS